MNESVSTGSGGTVAAALSTSMKAPHSFMIRRT